MTSPRVDEQAAKVRRGLRASREFINALPLSDGASRRAIDREFIATELIPDALMATDSLAAELASLKDALETSNQIEMSAYVLLLEVEALGLSLNGQEALHDELAARGATFPDPAAREALGRQA